MRPLPLLALIAMTFLHPTVSEAAKGKLVASELINSEGFAFQSREFGQLRLVKIAVRKEGRPACRVNLDGVERALAEGYKNRTLTHRPLPGSANGIIVTIRLELNSVALVRGSAEGQRSIFEISPISLPPPMPRNEWISGFRRRAFG